MRRFAIACLTVLTLSASTCAAEPPSPAVQMLFDSGQEGYPRYRIPALLVAPGGDLLAFCEGRKDGAGFTGNIDVVMKRSGDSGKTWSPLRTIVDDGKHTCGYPSPVVDRKTKTIFLAYTRTRGDDTEEEVVSGKSRDTTRVMIVASRDNGATWSAPVEISSTAKKADWTWYGFGSGIGIQLHSGRLVIPAYHAVAGSELRQAHMLYSDDHGSSWKVGGPVADETGECQIAQRRDGVLYCTARSHDGQEQRITAVSKDDGLTWNQPEKAPLLYDSICQADVYAVPSTVDAGQPLWLFSNPAGPGRTNLTLRTSTDEGKTWSAGKLLQPDNAQYSSLAELPDGAIGCLYDRWEDGNYRIRFARFPLAWLAPTEVPQD
ncbi:sialidase family protein [Lignipirellula cremea]|uniref:exo-alpha-sialidase n=1 Tax=Lignipirellula cremea TaxID=2528010 RepID=A0A518DS32_9BACT|nr:sialidase family protein [Lignipirellula cremea]QDU94646.1 Sialidase precursor [Lignipirellula cremea]